MEQGKLDDVLQRVIHWAQQRDEVRALLLTSTRALPTATVDRLSDYDIILVVRDIRPFFDDRTWLQDFGDVLVAYWDDLHHDHDGRHNVFSNVIQYADGLKIDWTLWPVALLQEIVQSSTLPAELDAGYRILLDKDRLTQAMLPPTYKAYIPQQPTEEAYRKAIEEFFSDVPYVAKCLWRDQLLPAKWCLDYDMKHVYLRVMLEWRVECDLQWSATMDAFGKGLKKRLAPEVWSELECTYAGADIAENWEALFRTIALYRSTALAVGRQLGYAYPQELDDRVTAYARQIQHLEHDHR